MIQPTKWSVPLGSGADVQELPDDDLKFASFSKIFPQITQVPLSAGGVAPRRIDFNSLFKLLADNIYYYQNGGVFEYSDNADYEKGALVKYNNELYLCIQDNSSFNKHAPTDAEYWLRVALNNDLANYLPLAGGNVTGNLTVQNKNVIRSVNGVNSDAEGNINVARPVVDYTSGIDIAYRNAGGGAFPRVTIPQDGLLVLFGRSAYPVTVEAYALLRIMNGDTAIFEQVANQTIINETTQIFASVNLPVRKGQQVECAITGNSERICRLYPYIME